MFFFSLTNHNGIMMEGRQADFAFLYILERIFQAILNGVSSFSEWQDKCSACMIFYSILKTVNVPVSSQAK